MNKKTEKEDTAFEGTNCPVEKLATMLESAPATGGGPGWDKTEAMAAVRELQKIMELVRNSEQFAGKDLAGELGIRS
jgi:hypothetical protein